MPNTDLAICFILSALILFDATRNVHLAWERRTRRAEITCVIGLVFDILLFSALIHYYPAFPATFYALIGLSF
jgi:hypothetical protein